MAEQISIPYPNPNYDDDLLAKEIINGTYIASINMMIRNSKTGEERYVHVPDSPNIIDGAENGRLEDYTVNNLSDEPIIYDRNKSLEDAVLPVKVDVGDEIPKIVSTAMCPQDVEYIGNIEAQPFVIKNYSRYDDGINKFLVIYEKTDDGSSPLNFDGDIYTFYKIEGTAKTKLFDFSVDDYGRPTFIYSIGKRNFILAGGKVYEYSKDGFVERLTVSIYTLLPFMVRDGDKIYIVGIHGNIQLQNVDDGSIIDSGFHSDGFSNLTRASAYADNFFVEGVNTFYIEDGVLNKIKGHMSFFASTAKLRFDYLVEHYFAKYNESFNIYTYPRARLYSYYVTYLEDSKEAFFTVGQDKKIYYTKDYVNYKYTGVNTSETYFTEYKIANFEDYVYIIGRKKIDVFKINRWGYVIPRSDLGEEFAKKGMINRGFNVIGD